MYIVSLIYTATLERIDDALPAHRTYLDAQFEAGNFIAAGPKMPRERLDALLAADPFAQQGLATYEVTEFKATRLAPGLNLPRPETP